MKRRRLAVLIAAAGLARHAEVPRAQPAGAAMRRIGVLFFGTAPGGASSDPGNGASPGSARTRAGRGPQPGNRVPLRRRPARAAGRAGRRTHRAEAGCDRGRRPGTRAGGAQRDEHGCDRRHRRQRSGRRGVGAQPGTSRRQRHGADSHVPRPRPEVPRTDQAGRAGTDARGRSVCAGRGEDQSDPRGRSPRARAANATARGRRARRLRSGIRSRVARSASGFVRHFDQPARPVPGQAGGAFATSRGHCCDQWSTWCSFSVWCTRSKSWTSFSDSRAVDRRMPPRPSRPSRTTFRSFSSTSVRALPSATS